ncbi:MAG TPA: hypothetical protein VF200_06140 [Woeseiaceae bacterium]
MIYLPCCDPIQAAARAAYRSNNERGTNRLTGIVESVRWCTPLGGRSSTGSSSTQAFAHPHALLRRHFSPTPPELLATLLIELTEAAEAAANALLLFRGVAAGSPVAPANGRTPFFRQGAPTFDALASRCALSERHRDPALRGPLRIGLARAAARLNWLRSCAPLVVAAGSADPTR